MSDIQANMTESEMRSRLVRECESKLAAIELLLGDTSWCNTEWSGYVDAMRSFQSSVGTLTRFNAAMNEVKRRLVP